MPSVHETAYPCFRMDITKRDLAEIYTPGTEEQNFVERHTRKDVTRLGFLILLKIVQRLGYFVPVVSVPPAISRYIAKCLDQQFDPDSLKEYDESRIKWNHVQWIRTFLGIKPFTEECRRVFQGAAREASRTKDDVADIINAGIEELVRLRMELPAFDTLVREARKARAWTNTRLYHQVFKKIDEEDRKLIDDILKVDQSTGRSLLNELREDTGKPTLKVMRDLIRRLFWLRNINRFAGALENIPYTKFRHLGLEAHTLDAARIRNISEKKRCVLVVTLIKVSLARVLDDLCEIMIKRVGKIHRSGKDRLIEYLEENQDKTDAIVSSYKEIHDVFSNRESPDEQVSDIKTIFAERPDLVDYSKHHTEFQGKNYFRLLWTYFKNSRVAFFDILSNLHFISTSEDKAIEQAIEFAQAHRKTISEWIPTHPDKKHTKRGLPNLNDFSWISDKWWKLITGQKKRVLVPERVNRRYFEVCLFSEIVSELKNGDLCVEDSEKYADFRNQLVSWEEYNERLLRYGELVGIPTEKDAFLYHVTDLLKREAKESDRTFLENVDLRITEDGEITLKKLTSHPEPEDLKVIEAQIMNRLNPRDILDVLVDTQNVLDWTRVFGPVSGLGTKIKDPAVAYVIAAFCYGCNLGPMQTSRVLPILDRRQIAWVNQRHITEESLQKAIEVVVTAYNKFALPKYWGDGSSAAADGTKWDLYERNLLSEYHIRYGGYGGIAYYHVSDKYIALFSRFIPCGVYEAVYILDGLIENKSEIQPETLHSDTHGQSLPVFGLAFILGINLMPRIRNWKSLKIFKASRSIGYQHIDPLFTRESINWNLIEKHLPDMIRVAISIQTGRISASAILRRLGTYSRKNKLYFAFQELGKVVRSVFLLRYLREPDLRRRINHATTVSEAFNGFVKWLAFGNGGIIAENSRDEQRKIIRYGHLVANLLIFMNVHDQTRVLRDLVQEDYRVTPHVLTYLSPYRTGHVNRFGNYHLNMEREPIQLHYGEDFMTTPGPFIQPRHTLLQ